ncbi:hypothetical protein Peur_068002 [Populus x canadensis]
MLWNFCDEIDKGESDQVGASYQNQGQSSNEPIPDKQASNGLERSEEKYCDDRRHPDPLSFFYEALFVGFEWGDVLNNDDFNHPSPSTSGYYLSA